MVHGSSSSNPRGSPKSNAARSARSRAMSIVGTTEWRAMRSLARAISRVRYSSHRSRSDCGGNSAGTGGAGLSWLMRSIVGLARTDDSGVATRDAIGRRRAVRRKVVEPVAVQSHRGSSPAGEQLARRIQGGELAEQLRAPIALGAALKRFGSSRGLGIEVVARYGRVSIDRAFQEAADITPVLPVQRARIVLGVSLEEQEQASLVFHEGVGARFVGDGENVVARRGQAIARQRVEARVRKPPLTGQTGDERMLPRAGAGEHAVQLRFVPLPPNTVEIQHRGVRGETGPDRRGRVLGRPADESRERIPVHLVRDHVGTRFGARDDQPIEAAGPQALDGLVVLGDVGATFSAADQLGKRKEVNVQGPVAGCGLDQLTKLALRGLES